MASGVKDGADVWLALPKATERAAQKLGFDRAAAREWMFNLASNNGVRSRAALVFGFVFCRGEPLRDRPLGPQDWQSFADLAGPWWETGNGEWANCEAKYLGIQINAGDLGVHLGEPHAMGELDDAGAPAKRGRPSAWKWEEALAHLGFVDKG